MDATSLMSLPREIHPPDLSPREVSEIGTTVFADSVRRPTEVLFIFGTSVGDWDLLAQTCVADGIPRVLVNGRTGRWQREAGKPLARLMRDELVARGVSPDRVLVQDRSTNTREDAELGLELLADLGLDTAPLTFASKAHHSGRCRLTLRRASPTRPLGILTFPGVYDGVPIRKEDWAQHGIARRRVFGEYQRILKYFGRQAI